MIETQFKDALTSAGLNTRDQIVADGKLRRFHVDGDRRGQFNGWYILFDDGCPSGAFGNWKTGEKHKWHVHDFETLSKAQKEEHRQKMLQARQEREAKDQRIKTQAAKKAQKIWDQAKPCPDTHPYLMKKNVKAHGIRLSGNKLVIPMRNINGNLHSLQFIDEHGNKRFLSGGRKKGCFLTLGSPYSALNIAEGYSTAATLFESAGTPTVVSFDAGNMIYVAKAWRSKYPTLEITLCADNDTRSSINIGVTKAREAAKAVGGLVAIPPCHGDFNDFYNGAE